MTKRSKQIYRICKQTNADIWGKLYKIDYSKRSGQHSKLKKKRKEFAFIYKDLKKKKLNTVSKYEFVYKLRKFYINISKKQFDNLCNKSKLMDINSKPNINTKYVLNLLERRIDTIIYRINWAYTFFSARQLINHGHVLVNGNPIYSSSHIINIGDKIEIKKDSIPLIKQNILNNLENKKITINCPSYIEVNYNILCAIMITNPNESFIPFPTFKNLQQLKYFYL
jgi:small subunit ribosomal protein S4